MRKIKYFLGSLLHNGIAHPLMVILPERLGNRFHDWTLKFWEY